MTAPGLPPRAGPVAAYAPSRYATVRLLAEDGAPPRHACGPHGDGGCVRPRPPPPALAEARLAPFPQRGPPAALGAGARDPPGACRFDGGLLPGLVGHRRPPWRRRPP
jgi:hypothetical protein